MQRIHRMCVFICSDECFVLNFKHTKGSIAIIRNLRSVEVALALRNLLNSLIFETCANLWRLRDVKNPPT